MKKLFCMCVGLLFAFVTSSAQNPGTGAYPFASIDAKGFDSINLGNLNVRFSIPIVSRSGRGLPLQYALQYEGLIWTPVTSGTSQVWSPDPAWGFRGTLNGTVLAGYLTYQITSRGCPTPPNWSRNVPPATVYRGYTYHEATGAVHVFDYQFDSGCPLSDDDDGSVTGTGDALDGSGFSLYNGASQVKGRGGMIITPAYSAAGGQNVALTDSNGNQITSNGSGVYTDTLGIAALTLGSTASTTTVSYPIALQADNATTGTATIYYVSKTVRTNFQVSGIAEFGSTPVSLVDHVTLADGSTYQFSYEPTAGATDGAVTGRLASVTLPNGGVIGYSYTGCGSSGIGTDGSPCVLTRTANSYQKTYNHSAPTSGPFSNSTVDEAGNETDFTFLSGTDGKYYETSRTVKQNSVTTPTGADLEERTTYYNSDWSQQQTFTTITAVDVAEAQNGNRLNHTTSNYDATGSLLQSFLTRDFQDHLLRSVNYTYDSNGNLTDLLTKDGSGNMVAHSSYGYDESPLAATSGIPQHTSPAGARGNQTSSQQWIDASSYLSWKTAYYDTGVASSSSTPSGTTTFTYDATQGFVTGTSLPTPSSGVALSTSASYDTSSTALLSSTGLNSGQTVQVQQYDRLMRPRSVSYPDGGLTNYNYSTAYYNISFKVTSSGNGGSLTYYDGFGRVRRVSISNGSGWYVTDTCYGPQGWAQYVSVPYLSTAGDADATPARCSSSNAHSYAYDTLGRVTSITHPDNTSTTSSYLIFDGRFSTKSQNETGVVHIVDTDALGRTVIACNATGTSAQQADGENPGQCGTGIGAIGFPVNYTYNDAAHTTTITQGSQTRTFQTDALGRMTNTSEPERGATTYTYQYQGSELLVSRTRPAPNQASASVQVTTRTRYDTMGRSTIIDYFNPANNATFQPSRYFWYDKASDSSYPYTNANGLLAEAQLMTGDAQNTDIRFYYDIMGRVAGMYQCAPGWCSQPSTRAMYRIYGYDYAGNNTTEAWSYGYQSPGVLPGVTMTRTFTVAGELDAMSGGLSDGSTPRFPSFYQAGVHTPFGPVTETLGNGLVRNSIFDANGRDAGKFVCSGTTQPDCAGGGYLYGYRDTIVGNQVTHLGDTSLQRTSDFQYDDFGRLKGMTSDSGLSMSWTYDRYGNRYGQNGGGGGVNVPQPQLIYDTTTNRISGFSYDAAGNLMSDGLHSYTYDAEGNVTDVDGGSTAHNIYDALNRRVSQSVPGRLERYEYNAAGQVSDVWWNEEQYEHIARYTANGQPLAFWSNDPGGAHVHFQHPDYLGTVRFVTSYSGAGESAYRSLPFGESYSPIGPDIDRTHFAGLDHDTESNTDHAQFRQYSPTQGRWLSPDPYSGSYDITDQQTFNRYSYGMNSPLASLDPTGLVCQGAINAGIDPATGQVGGIMNPQPGDEGTCVSHGGFWYEPGGGPIFAPGGSTTVSSSGGTSGGTEGAGNNGNVGGDTQFGPGGTSHVNAPSNGNPQISQLACKAAYTAGGAAAGALVGSAAGGVVGGVAGGAGGTLVAPGVGTVGGGVAGAEGGATAGAWAGGALGGLLGNALGNIMCSSSASTGSSGGPQSPECKQEVSQARNYCSELMTNPGRAPNVWGGSFDRCVRGQVSQACGGNRVD